MVLAAACPPRVLKHPLAALGVLFALLSTAAADLPRMARVKSDRTNVRARPSYDGEVLVTLKRGTGVTVVAEVEGTEGEPGGSRRWAKVQLPAEVAVWVYAPLVDSKGRRVKSDVLKFRAGPGRNYSELGELKRGDPVAEIRRAEDWIQIEPPAQATAFVALSLLETGASGDSRRPAQLEVVPTPEPQPPIMSGDVKA